MIVIFLAADATLNASDVAGAFTFGITVPPTLSLLLDSITSPFRFPFTLATFYFFTPLTQGLRWLFEIGQDGGSSLVPVAKLAELVAVEDLVDIDLSRDRVGQLLSLRFE